MKTKEISLAGIWTALFAVIIILSNFIPGIEFFIILFSPIAVYLLKEKSNLKTVGIFIIALLFVGLIINYTTTLIYLLPSLLVGLFYGIFIKLSKNLIITTFLMGFIHAILLLISISIIDFLFASDIISYFKLVLLLSDSNFNDFSLMILFIISLSESILTSIVFYYEYQKLHKNKLNIEPNYSFLLITPLSLILFILIPIKNIKNLLLFIFVFSYLINVIFGYLKSNKKIKYLFICQILSMVLMIILLTILEDRNKLWAYCTLGLPSFCFLSYYLFILKVKNAKIEEKEELRI